MTTRASAITLRRVVKVGLHRRSVHQRIHAPMQDVVFTHLTSERVAQLVHSSVERVVYSGPGVHQPIAASLVNARKKLGREAVRVVLDVSDTSARLGFGEFDAIELLRDGDVDIRHEPGLRTCVLVCDGRGFAFFTPPMLVETPDDQHVGPNALALHAEQTRALVSSLFPSAMTDRATAVPPEIGQSRPSLQLLEQVKKSLDANPPQKFDLARKVNVFNAYIEFVELRLSGLYVSRHTVQLPRELVLATRDDATARRLLTTFKLIDDESKVAKEAIEIDRSVRALRDKYTRPLGETLGAVMLRSKRQAFISEAEKIRSSIARFQASVVDRLEKELANSRRKLVDGLLPAVKKSPPERLVAQLSGKPTVDVLRRYVETELARVFPSANSLVGAMRLEWVLKGVTYETLSNPEFQNRVRDAFPYENWDVPFREFEAAPSAVESRQPTLFR